jgi:hypothetical protein
MIIRRRLAGLLAICAFALSYSEALTAAACTMGTSAEMNDMGMDMPMDMPMEHSGEPADQVPRQPTDCPLSMPGSPASCIFSSAVTPAVQPFAAPLAGPKISFISPEDHYLLLLDHSTFHPPKA